jgi:hopanoid biosynthesis associated RND transporter like protein HpnN
MAVAGTNWISTLLARWVKWVLRHSAAVIVISLVAGVVCIRYAGQNLGINTDTANMISSALPWRQAFIDYRDSFPVRDRNIVIVVDAATPGLAGDFAERLTDKLSAQPELFESLYLAGAGDFFDRNGLLYLSLDDLQKLSDRLAAAQPLLGLIRERFNGAGVIGAFERIAGADSEQVPADVAELDSLYDELARSVEAAERGDSRALPWRRVLGVGGDTGTRRLILVQPMLDFNQLQPAGPAIRSIRDAAAGLREQLHADVSVRLTGQVAMEHEELVSVTRGAGFAGLSALILVGGVLYWALRSVRLLAISIVTLLVGLACTAAFAALSVGHLNLLSVAFAVLYVGLGVDFILHINLRFKELLVEGTSVHGALTETLRGVGASLFICAVTTAAGFYSFVPTPFSGVAELGLISGTGMFISLFVSVTLLPALIAQFVPADRAGAPLLPPSRRLGRWLTGRPKVVVAIATVAMLASLDALPGVDFDSNPVHLRDPASESVTTLEELAQASEAPLFNLFAIADDHRTATEWASRLRPLPVVQDVATVDSLVPDHQQDKLFVLDDISLLMGPDFATLERVPAQPSQLRHELADLKRELDANGPAGGGATHLSEALASLSAKLQELPADRAQQMLSGLGRSMTEGLQQELARLQKGLQAMPFDRKDLPPELARRWINDEGRELIEIIPSENVNDNDAAERFVSAVRAVVPNATGLPVVHEEASTTVVEAFSEAMAYALVLVTAILILFLRRLTDTLLVIVPILFAAGLTAAITVWLGVPLNFANIIALPLLVGVGVDNGIHIVHRMRTEPPRDGEPFSTSTSRAILTSGLTTIASFGNLAFSAHVGMASMGQLLTLGMAVTLAATLILLPALLKLGIRR